MDPIKEAFFKIKEEMVLLKEEIKRLNDKIIEIQTTPTHNITQTNKQPRDPTHIQTIPTHNTPQIPQQTNNPTHIQTIPTHNNPIQPPYTPNQPISTGNEGVPTHKPTHKPTNQQTQNIPNSDFKQANNILESLDNIKKEIRLKFKRLTPQEMLVFSTLYTFEEQGVDEITYRIIAKQLKLSESSIRDYTNKLIKKGIPIDKTRLNNKTIILKISQDLKKIATLATIQTLKDL